VFDPRYQVDQDPKTEPDHMDPYKCHAAAEVSDIFGNQVLNPCVPLSQLSLIEVWPLRFAE
jgi:hypothetical protein